MKPSLLFILAASTLFSSCILFGGKTTDTYPDGSPKSVTQITGMRNFELCQVERMYYANGLIKYEKRFYGNDKVPDGIWNFYYDNGQIFASADFSENHTEGSKWMLYSNNGEYIHDRNSYDSVCIAKKDDFDVPIKVIFYSGNKSEVVMFDEMHNIQRVQHFTDQESDGPDITYYPNGQAKSISFFSNGQKASQTLTFRKNGMPYGRNSTNISTPSSRLGDSSYLYH